MNHPKEFSQSISWVCEVFHDAHGLIQANVLREGMTRAEILENFPPPATSPLDYDRAGLVRAIIWEAYCEGVPRERGNVRSFWYERLMYAIRTIMRDPASKESINSTLNRAWGELVEGGWLTYEDLNLYSEKRTGYRVGVAEDSPYPTAIVLVEKADHFEVAAELADIYEITVVAAGGQASRAAAMAYVAQLERLKIDLAQDFTVYSMADFDPEGWDIPEHFISHLYTGGVQGRIELVRLGLLREQFGDTIGKVVDAYPFKGTKESARRAKQTRWENWAAETGGIWTPDGAPGRIELNIYRPSQLKQLIVDRLCELLDGFAFQVRGLREAATEGYDDAFDLASHDAREDVEAVYAPYFDASESATDAIDAEIAERTKSENARLRDLYAEIAQLEATKAEKTADLTEQRERIEALEERWYADAEIEFQTVWSNARANLTPEALVRKIEHNGGWEGFATAIDVTERLDSDDLKRFAARREPVKWEASYRQKQNAGDWVYDQITVTYPAPDGPDGTPQELVERARKGTA